MKRMMHIAAILIVAGAALSWLPSANALNTEAGTFSVDSDPVGSSNAQTVNMQGSSSGGSSMPVSYLASGSVFAVQNVTASGGIFSVETSSIVASAGTGSRAGGGGAVVGPGGGIGIGIGGVRDKTGAGGDEDDAEVQETETPGEIAPFAEEGETVETGVRGCVPPARASWFDQQAREIGIPTEEVISVEEEPQFEGELLPQDMPAAREAYEEIVQERITGKKFPRWSDFMEAVQELYFSKIQMAAPGNLGDPRLPLPVTQIAPRSSLLKEAFLEKYIQTNKKSREVGVLDVAKTWVRIYVQSITQQIKDRYQALREMALKQ